MIIVVRPLGEFTYCGVETGLRNRINADTYESDILLLQFHCDGLSVSCLEMYPLLCKIYSESICYEPFPVIYTSRSVPKYEHEYFFQFVFEIIRLLDTGLIISGRYFQIQIQCSIEDTLARASLKR